MAYVSTSDEKARILKNDKKKLQEEIEQKAKSVGLRGMNPLHGQDEYTQLEDMAKEENHIKETMANERERRIKRQQEEKKRKRKSFKEKLNMYFAQRERKMRTAFEERRFVFHDGGFDKFIKSIKMSVGRVLLQEVKREDNKDGIALPETYEEKDKIYRIIKTGKECNDVLESDMHVMVERYAGVEIVSGKETYLIVNDEDIVCIL